MSLQIPFGMKIGAPVSVGKYIAHSMIPVFIGNTIAGTQPSLPLRRHTTC